MNSEFWRGQRVLVTGGSGFVGRWLCRALASAGAELHILDLAPPQHFDKPHTFHQTDLRSLGATSDLLSRCRPDVILHLAGQPGVATSHNDPVGAYESNVLATFNVLEASRRYGAVKSILAVSSNHVYGDQESMPSAESAPLNGVGMYAASKLCGDVLARAYGKTYRLPVGIVRMTNSYGGDDHHVTHIITGTILAVLRGEKPVIKQSGRDRKGYQYIKDTVEGLLAVAEGTAKSPELWGESFNLAPNETVTVLDLVRTIVAAGGGKAEPDVQAPDAHFEEEQLDNSKARRLLGWSPKFSLAEGLRETFAWYREHGVGTTSGH